MLKRLVNEARFKLLIKATGPLLIKSGHATITGPDMTPVLTYRNGEWQVYLPGSSLKGVFRSHLEKVCRTLRDEVVCNPFLKLKDVSRAENGRLVCSDYTHVACSDKFEIRGLETEKRFEVADRTKWRHLNPEKLINSEVYADSCPVCRLFGSTSYIGRVSIGDAHLVDVARPRPTESRDGVGIDRLTGGAAHGAKFELEVVSTGTTFETEILVRNFETWQLGMLLLVVQDLADGLVRVGSGRSRGLGAVKGQINQVTIAYLGNVVNKPPGEVWGLGRFLLEEDGYARYGTWPDDLMTIEPNPIESRQGIRRVATFEETPLADLQSKSIAAFVQRIQDWQVPQTMSFAHLQFEER